MKFILLSFNQYQLNNYLLLMREIDSDILGNVITEGQICSDLSLIYAGAL
jgi:hypothetical protein